MTLYCGAGAFASLNLSPGHLLGDELRQALIGVHINSVWLEAHRRGGVEEMCNLS